MNLFIPHLAVGQTIQEWKSEFITSTITLKPAQRLEVFPSYINRYPEETELATIAAKKDTVVPAAFKELAKLIDVRTDEIADFKDFIDCRLGCSNIAAQDGFLFDLQALKRKILGFQICRSPKIVKKSQVPDFQNPISFVLRPKLKLRWTYLF